MTDPRHTILAQKLEVLPEHVAIIMDGNNRWAKNQNLTGVRAIKQEWVLLGQ